MTTKPFAWSLVAVHRSVGGVASAFKQALSLQGAPQAFETYRLLEKNLFVIQEHVMKLWSRLAYALILVLAPLSWAQAPVGTQFTYQGSLKNTGLPANGTFDLQFRLFTEASGGVQVGPTLCFDQVVMTNGLFTVSLDFGQVFGGDKHHLNIGVRADATPGNCGSGVYSTLSPRQEVAAAPYALHALNAASCVRSIADLRAMAVPPGTAAEPPSRQVLGYSTAGDGGGGLFFWDALSVEADDGGLVIDSTHPSSPATGRWKRVFSGPVHVEWWGPVGDGVANDTAPLQAALSAAAGRGIVLAHPRMYAFDPVLTIPADVRIENNGATLVLRTSLPGTATAITLGDRVHADLLKIVVPGGVTVQRLLLVGHEADIGRIEVISVNRQNNFANNLDGALQVRTQNVRLGKVSITNFDRGVTLYQAGHVVIERLDIRGYVQGLQCRECAFVELISGEITIPSAGAGTLSGHDGLLFSDSFDVVVSDMIIHDAGEHAVQIGGVSSQRFVFNNIQAVRPGQCGLKINPTDRVRDVQINGLTVIDAAATSTPSPNEDGLRLEKASQVTVNGFQVQARDRAVSANVGIYLNACDNVTINGPRISSVASHGIHLQDLNGVVNSIYLNNPTVLVAGGNGILIESPTQILRDITVLGCYIRGFANRGVFISTNFVNQPVILQGFIRNDVGLGAFFASVNDPDIHNNLIVY